MNETATILYLFLSALFPLFSGPTTLECFSLRLTHGTKTAPKHNLQRKEKKREKRWKVEGKRKKTIWCHSSVFATFSSSAESSFF